ncbi:MAG: DUF4240 domain-containing protein [Fimbriimonadaceae bacterium]|nr:DUF4240 domain-containing protein [Fimbriimonadaceae bacterium]
MIRKIMDINAFWNTIDQARGAAPGTAAPDKPSASEDALNSILSKLPITEVQDFGRHFNDQLIRLNRWSVWGAGYVIAGGMSDDSFHYFRSWLIGKGKSAVELALSDPDALGPYVTEEDEENGVDNEGLEYVAVGILEEAEVDDPRDNADTYADDDPQGEPFDEDTVAEQYPRLAQQFWD